MLEKKREALLLPALEKNLESFVAMKSLAKGDKSEVGQNLNVLLPVLSKNLDSITLNYRKEKERLSNSQEGVTENRRQQQIQELDAKLVRVLKIQDQLFPEALKQKDRNELKEFQALEEKSASQSLPQRVLDALKKKAGAARDRLNQR
jgi:hypothetical protein